MTDVVDIEPGPDTCLVCRRPVADASDEVCDPGWHRAMSEERDAWRRFESATDRVVDAMQDAMIYRMGDGHGGACIDHIERKVRDRFGSRSDDTRKVREHKPRPTGHHRMIHSLIERDGDRCAYCKVQVSCACHPDRPAGCADHVTPRSRGGADGLENRVLACVPCNSSKGDRTPNEWQGR